MTWCRCWWHIDAGNSGHVWAFCRRARKSCADDHLDLDSLTEWITDQHRGGRPVAVHCVTAAQLVVTIAALRAAGSHPADRIEHAAVADDGSLPTSPTSESPW